MSSERPRRVLAGLGLTLLIAGLSAGLGAGCGGDPPQPTPTVPTFSPTTGPTGTTTTPPPTRTLPVDCGQLLPTAQVDLVLGQPLVGRVQAITGIPEPKIKRLERFTCRYGLPPPPLPPDFAVPLEVSVSRYADEASATERISATVESERARGAAPANVPVGPVEGTVLIAADRRLLVAVNGPVTVAVTLAPGLADDRVNEVLSELGSRAIAAVT